LNLLSPADSLAVEGTHLKTSVCHDLRS
jgi:hypothetical protein